MIGTHRSPYLPFYFTPEWEASLYERPWNHKIPQMLQTATLDPQRAAGHWSDPVNVMIMEALGGTSSPTDALSQSETIVNAASPAVEIRLAFVRHRPLPRPADRLRKRRRPGTFSPGRPFFWAIDTAQSLDIGWYHWCFITFLGNEVFNESPRERETRPIGRQTLMRDFTSGSIPRHLFLFSLPMFLGNLLQALYNTVDSFWVGRYIGPEALGAVSVSFPVIFAIISLVMGLTMATTTMVAQYRGAGQDGMVKKTVANSILLISVVGLVSSIVGYFLRDGS